MTALALLTSCERNPEGVPDKAAPEELVPVRFTAEGSLDYSVTTRSDLSTMRKDGFGVMGYNTGTEGFNADSPSGLVFDNLKMTSEDGDNWTYSDKVAYWNATSTEKYTFLAYHPYDESLETTDLLLPASGSKISDCIDFIVSEPVVDQTTKQSVNLEFGHIFSKFIPRLKLTKAYDGQSYTLKSIKFKEVNDYETYSLAKGDFDRTRVVTHTIESEKENIHNPTLSSVAEEITVDPVFVSPYAYETENKSVEVEFEFEYVFAVDGVPEVTNTFTKTISVSKNLEKNRAYNLNVNFTPDEQGGVRMAVTLDDYSEEEDFNHSFEQTPATDLSAAGLANSYIVEREGYYKIYNVYKDNARTQPVGDIDRVEVLWESFGTDEEINAGDLVYNVVLSGDYIVFNTTGKKGNALLAAKDAEGKVLWSWHIWLTDMPGNQVYNNGAGTMMDRNLGATSASKADGVKTYGLFYQWGRKDPFLAAGTAGGTEPAASTAEWPEPAMSDPAVGTRSYADANPMSFIVTDPDNDHDYDEDWLWQTKNDKRWGAGGGKTVDDPCPYGYRVAYGGESGLWALAFGDGNAQPVFEGGFDFGAGNGGKAQLTADESCWYPANGRISSSSGGLLYSGSSCNYWSRDVHNALANHIYRAYTFYVHSTSFDADYYTVRAEGSAVRCMSETL